MSGSGFPFLLQTHSPAALRLSDKLIQIVRLTGCDFLKNQGFLQVPRPRFIGNKYLVVLARYIFKKTSKECVNYDRTSLYRMC